ncbi:MAG: hypothetical protein WD768_19040 [Phycisphaeraceae bacterium]
MIAALRQFVREPFRVLFFLWALAFVYMLGWVALELLAFTPLESLTRPLYAIWRRPYFGYAWLDWGLQTAIVMGGATVVFLLVGLRGAMALRSPTGAPVFLRMAFILIASVAVLFGVGYQVRASGASESSRASSLVTQLQTLRSQLELYQVQHEGDYPTLAQLQAGWGVMVNKTHADGTIDPIRGDYGPYLQWPPKNAIIGSAIVSADNTGAWRYNEKTGDIVALLPPQVILDMGFALTDVAPMSMMPGDSGIEHYLALSALMHRERVIGYVTSLFHLIVPILLLVIAFLRWRVMSSWVDLQPPARRQVAGMLTFLAAAALYLLVQSMNHDWDPLSQLAFAWAFIAASFFGLMMGLRWDGIDKWQYAGWMDPTICRQCQYDLRGTLMANRCSCPECGLGVSESPDQLTSFP